MKWLDSPKPHAPRPAVAELFPAFVAGGVEFSDQVRGHARNERVAVGESCRAEGARHGDAPEGVAGGVDFANLAVLHGCDQVPAAWQRFDRAPAAAAADIDGCVILACQRIE